MFRKLILFLLPLLLTADPSFGSSYLLFFEAQGVGGYTSREDKWVPYSRTREDVMQKPSVGFDYLQRFSGETGDIGAFALQARVAYSSQEDYNLEPQIYNAYFKFKSPLADVWVGHNRPAMGLSSYFDSHGLLLGTLAMSNFGFDRDWGMGAYRDFSWGNIAISYTTGTGMPVRFEGNYLAAARISTGFLNQDNYNLGFSVSYGKTMETMGYEVMDDNPKPFSMAGVDFTYLWNNFESRFEVMGGENRDEDSYALFWRLGVNLMEENRLKFEVQPAFMKTGSKDEYQVSAGPSFLLTSDLALRAMYQYDDTDGLKNDHRFMLQLYFYKRL